MPQWARVAAAVALAAACLAAPCSTPTETARSTQSGGAARETAARKDTKKHDQPRTASLLLRRTGAVGGTAAGAWGAAEACMSKFGVCGWSRMIASRF